MISMRPDLVWSGVRVSTRTCDDPKTREIAVFACSLTTSEALSAMPAVCLPVSDSAVSSATTRMKRLIGESGCERIRSTWIDSDRLAVGTRRKSARKTSQVVRYSVR